MIEMNETKYERIYLSNNTNDNGDMEVTWSADKIEEEDETYIGVEYLKDVLNEIIHDKILVAAVLYKLMADEVNADINVEG